MNAFANTFFEYFHLATRDRIIYRFSVVLISIDIVFLLIDLTRRFAYYFHGKIYFFSSEMFSISEDMGYPEIYTYFKTILIVIILCHSCFRFRDAIYGSWAFVYLIVLLVDTFPLHERLGVVLQLKFGLPSVLGLEGDHIGEIMVWVALGLPIAGALCYGFSRSRGIHKIVGQMFGVFFFLLVFFAMGMDMLHNIVQHVLNANSDSVGAVMQGAIILLEVLEDGGEMVTLSVTCAFTIVVGRHIVTQVRTRPSGSTYRP